MRRIILAFLALCSLVSVSAADEIRLLNGDLVRGKVKSLDEKTLVLTSENFGELRIPKDKVAAIHLGDLPVVPALPPVQAPPLPPAATPVESKVDPKLTELDKELASLRKVRDDADERLKETLLQTEREDVLRLRDQASQQIERNAAERARMTQLQHAQKTKASNDQLVEQLRGVDPGYLKVVEQAFPLLNSSPEAKKYFTDRVGGLMSGKVKIDDVRTDAKKVVAELEDLKSDLGEGTGAALDGYLSILRKFLDETEPDATKIPKDRPLDPKSIQLESPQQLDDKIRAIEEELKKSLEQRDEQLKKVLEGK